MMKHAVTLNLALASLFVLPAVDGQEPVDLVRRLEATLGALDELAGIQERISSGVGVRTEALLAVTEPAIADPQTRDEELTVLRDEVSALRMRHDELVAGGPPAGRSQLPLPEPAADARGGRSSGPATAEPAPGTGPVVTSLSRRGNRAPAGAPRDVEKDPGFNVDALRQGALLAQTGRHDEARPLLEGRPEPEARYWLARCYEGLGRRTEAIAVLSSLQADDRAGAYQRRAKYDLGFLEIKAELEQRRAARGGDE